MPKFNLVSPYTPAGDQPRVIKEITESVASGRREQTIKGVTGIGKTYIMASIVNNLNRPTLVIAHNKTLAAQLAEEFQRFFPNNAVHYFVSYYDYYQPESYIPRTDTYIEKQTQINEEIERLRNATTQSLLTRKDVLIVSSVSCIYGLGNPEDYNALKIEMQVGQKYNLGKLIRRLIDMQYARTNLDLKRGWFRLRGGNLEIYPTSEDGFAYRFSFLGDTLERIEKFDILTGKEVEDKYLWQKNITDSLKVDVIDATNGGSKKIDSQSKAKNSLDNNQKQPVDVDQAEMDEIISLSQEKIRDIVDDFLKL